MVIFVEDNVAMSVTDASFKQQTRRPTKLKLNFLCHWQQTIYLTFAVHSKLG
jgi:hypothetical protein